MSMAVSEQENNTVFARRIWNANLDYRGKIIIAMLSFLGWCGFSTIYCQEEGIQYELFLNGLYLLLVLISSAAWINRYLYLDFVSRGIGTGVQSLLEVMRFHAFDVEAYFALIRKSLWKLLPVHALFFLLRLCLCGACEYQWTWQKGLLMAGTFLISFLCPYLFCQAKKEYYCYRLCHSQKTTVGICLSVASVILRFLVVLPEVAMIIGGGTVLSFLSGTFLSSIFAVAPIQEGIIWRRNYDTAISGFACLILMLAVSLWAVEGYLFIKRKRTAVILFAMLSFAMLALSIVEANTYTDFYDGRIVSRNLWNVKEYQQKDIVRFCISADGSDIQMALFMQDGEKLKLGAASFENSDLYDEKYSGDYMYIADYAEELEEQGISGELRNDKELRESVEELNEEEQEGWERISALFN